MDVPGHEDQYTQTTSISGENVHTHDSSASIILSLLSTDLSSKPNSKFTLKYARRVDKHTLTDDQLTSPGQIPDYIYKTLMIANYNVREFKLKSVTSSTHEFGGYDSNRSIEEDDFDDSEDEDIKGINPMDALLGVFYCSDDSLRRYLALKLSECQLSVPFLLPDLMAASENVTILLSALESITKSWRSASDDNESVQEVFATEHPFPVVSFIRVGKPTMSKSSLMNKIMSDGSSYHNFFFHKNMKGGNVNRKIVDGLVELSWYLPGGSQKQTLKTEICFANLRGDARYFKDQLNVLLDISSLLCILLPSQCPDETVQDVFKKTIDSKAKVILIFNEKTPRDAKEYFKHLRSKHGEKFSFIAKTIKSNDYDFLQSIRASIQKNVKDVKRKPLVAFASRASEFGIHPDGYQSNSTFGPTVDNWLKMGIEKAKDLLKLQTYVPEFANLDRELNRPTRQGDKSVQEYVDELHESIEENEKAQRESLGRLDERVLYCLNSIAITTETGRNFALKRLKHQLDKRSLQIMGELRQEYRTTALGFNKKKEDRDKHLKQLEESISKCSFGLEHILRELAQKYQLDESKYDYAGAAAEMLLSGHPLELVDGDSFYIPLEWFHDVYTKLQHKTKNAKIFVISVVGIQSSGKSTMLNAMFGLEFPVSAGRCTRGVFASLIPVSDSLMSVSKFEYVLIIDTEGLRGSGDNQLREHDNELATFAIGVADVTIVNIFGENHNVMKEFLETAVHAFLKMKLVEETKKKSCKIVHQNVTAADATERLVGDRLNLKQDLDEMTKLSATLENCNDKFNKFNDIISFNENEDVFYLPSLKGNPPMAPVNPEYGRAVQRIKNEIITLMCSKESSYHSVAHFRRRVADLWKATMKEDFIFSLRNAIEIRARISLDRKYLQESVTVMLTGMAGLKVEIEVALKRCSTWDERKRKWAESEQQIRDKAEEGGEKVAQAMKDFFETSEDKATLEQWRENILTKIKAEKEIQVLEVTRNCLSTFNHLQKLQDIEDKKLIYEEKLLNEARKLITLARNTEDEAKLMEIFEKKWQKWIAGIPPCQESEIDVNSEMVNVLCNTDSVLSRNIREKLEQQIYVVSNFKTSVAMIGVDDLTYTMGPMDSFCDKLSKETRKKRLPYAEKVKKTAIKKTIDFAKTTSGSGVRFTRNDLIQMYNNVVTTIEDRTMEFDFKFSNSLKCDILLYTFAKTYEIFRQMEQRYVQERDIRVYMEKELRPRLEKYFINVCKKMEKEKLSATLFVDVLQQQIESALTCKMGPAVAREIFEKGESEFQDQGQFHARVLIQLGEEGKFDSYIPYIENPLEFLIKKFMELIQNYCLNHPAYIAVVLKDEVSKIKSVVFDAITTAGEEANTGGENLTFWIQQFVEKCSILVLKTEMFRVASIENLEKFDLFQKIVREKVAEFFKLMKTDEIDLATYKRWDPSPHDCLFSRMFPCQSSCPFCDALCDRPITGHEKHSTHSHRPVGIIGYKEENTRLLSQQVCTNNIAGTKAFRNPETSWKWVLYKDYRTVNDYYNSWNILADSSLKPSKYWKWFMETFSKDLAEYHQANNGLHFFWNFRTTQRKNTNFENAKKELLRKFNM